MHKHTRMLSALAASVLAAGLSVGATAQAAPAPSTAKATGTATSDGGELAAKRALTATGSAPDSVSVVTLGGVGAADWRATRYGYTGTFRDGSSILDVAWTSSRLESFGIAPGRTIWHAWPGSGGWKQMPHNGRADDVGAAAKDGARRAVSVWVNNSGYWCSVDPGNGRWGAWSRC
ncbi:hypothetical protein [Streptomyces sp. WAC 01529]|uniref:hypothetical protein n=1 Tax=Streptomyces sp. WAC 01529 TaxID=2203205 RepID=UPI000F749259|nr:hypothetical protein [Streptomyces sp. WAC 01529]